MDPCPFVWLTVGNLALKIPVASKPARSVVHPSSSPCFCKSSLIISRYNQRWFHTFCRRTPSSLKEAHKPSPPTSTSASLILTGSPESHRSLPPPKNRNLKYRSTTAAEVPPVV
ncbi:Formin-like protein [Forsythia ovata]|uniref:Formin-like protein n=1 Tax=Forsythia ovata TaxID=205694 RepID=A0ABD1TU11_9LAMI